MNSKECTIISFQHLNVKNMKKRMAQVGRHSQQINNARGMSINSLAVKCTYNINTYTFYSCAVCWGCKGINAW